jgi:CO/xanthine dehydrogenase FAD-binding subunit
VTVFRPKDFLLSDKKEEAFEILRREGKHAHVIAGGTGFYELARRGYIPEVKHIVSIMKLGLDYVKEGENNIVIGATTRLQSLLESGIGEKTGLEAIGDALLEIRPVQVRNVATLGGEICISVPIVDLPTALLACDASLGVFSGDGAEYSTKLEDFYIDAFLTKLKYGEIVKEIILPRNNPENQSRANPGTNPGTNPNARSAFVKIGRTAYDFNLINAAVSLSIRPDGKVDSIRVFLGGIKRTPLRALNFEKRMMGKELDENLITAAAREAFGKEKLFPSVHGSSEYKMELLPIVLRDCVMKAFERAPR